MAQKNYAITETAGRYVAGVPNTGVGTLLVLTEKQAEAGLRDGTLVDAGAIAPDTPFAVSTISGTAGGAALDPDTIPKAADPDAPARAAGTASIEDVVRAQREAEEGTVTEPQPKAAKQTASAPSKK